MHYVGVKIAHAAHKAILYAELRTAGIPVEKLAEASSLAKKLLEGSAREETFTRFTDGEQTFTLDEWNYLRDLLKQKKTGELQQVEVLLELRKIFEL